MFNTYHRLAVGKFVQFLAWIFLIRIVHFLAWIGKPVFRKTEFGRKLKFDWWGASSPFHLVIIQWKKPNFLFFWQWRDFEREERRKSCYIGTEDLSNWLEIFVVDLRTRLTLLISSYQRFFIFPHNWHSWVGTLLHEFKK